MKLATILLGVSAAFVLACGTADGPAPSAEFGSHVENAPSSSSPICIKGQTQECRRYWTGAGGDKHCVDATQYCGAHGYAWTACGEEPTESDWSAEQTLERVANPETE
jgi:hypothetical protein